jgi:hypothetical protein
MPEPKRPEQMVDAATHARLEAERQKVIDAEAAQNAADDLPADLTMERLRTLKDGYRKTIEERLRNKRRQRKLMRGGDLAK